MGDDKRDTESSRAPFPSQEPDTDPASPPTPIPGDRRTPVSQRTTKDVVTPGAAASSKSVHVSFDMDSSASPKTVTHPSHLATTTRSQEDSSPGEEVAPPETSNDKERGSTTLQSMMRPDLRKGGMPDSRRFLSIENDLDQAQATLRLLEKGLVSAQKEARIAWILATCALLVAALAVAI